MRTRTSSGVGGAGRPAPTRSPETSAALGQEARTGPGPAPPGARALRQVRHLIAQADAKGQLRLAENLRRVQASLDQIIPALEAPGKDGPDDEPR